MANSSGGGRQDKKKKKSSYAESVMNGTYKSKVLPANEVPKIKTTSSKKEEKRTWFDTGAFDDGYQFGDLFKTGLATVEDVSSNISAGILGIGEKAVDAGAFAIGKVGSLFGNDKFEDKMGAFIQKDLIDEEALGKKFNINSFTFTGGLNKLLNGNSEKNSVLGEKSDALVQSGGQLLGTAALQMVGIPWYVTTGATSFGGETENALKSGATYNEAGFSALVSAGAEILTEKISGGISFGGKTLDAGLKKKITETITSKTISNLTKYGVDVGLEGFEEVLSEVLSNVGKKLSYEDEKTWGEILASEEALESYVDSFVGGAILGGGANVGKITTSIKQGRDYDTGLTPQEELSVGVETNNRIESIEAEGNKLTAKQKEQIREQVTTEVLNKQKQQTITDDIAPVLEQPTNTIQSVENIDSQIATLEEQLMATENEAEYQRLSEQIRALEEQANQLEQQDIAPVQTQVNEQVQNEDIAPYQVANVEETQQPTTQEVNSNLPVEVESNTQNIENIEQTDTNAGDVVQVANEQETTKGTPITKTIEELQIELENAKGIFAKGAIQQQISALENGFKTVEEYREFEESKRKANLEDLKKEKEQRKHFEPTKVNSRNINDPVEKGYTRLYRGLENEYSSKYDRNLIDNSNGYESWTDDYELAKAYGKNVYSIDVPTNEISKEVFKEDGERNLLYFNDKPVGIKGKNGKEYMLNTNHENHKKVEYRKVEETPSQTQESDTKAETKRTTPTQEELDNLEYTRKNKSGSEYASEYYALGKKYGTTNLYKALNNYKSTGQAIEDIAPVKQELEDLTSDLKETIKDTKKEIKTLKKELNEAKSTISELVEESKALTEVDLPMVEQEALNNMKSATDDMAPVREDTTPEYEFENDNEGNRPNVIDPMQDRTLEDVGSRKIKALQQENPEIKPFFQEEAKRMLNDLQNSVKGVRMPIYDEVGNMTYAGTTRQTTSDIEALLDSQYGYTYADIEKGLNAIIEDNGKENIAVAKRIEFALNDRLLHGYTDITGTQIPANQDYINMLRGQEYTNYYDSLQKSDIAPFENALESQIENALSNKNSKSKRYLGKVTDYVANKIKDVLGINVNNRRHVLSDNDIRHMFKQHGNQDVETLKGQIAITKEDIKNIPDIINSPTDIVKGTDNKAGQTIRYIKRYNDNTTNVVEVVPDNSNALIIKTMWKKPSTLTNSIAPSSTSETQGSDISSTFANNIYQNEENVNNIAPIRNQYEAIAPIRDVFDNGGPMLRVSPEMDQKTLNKNIEKKDVNWEALEDTSQGEQQSLKVKKLGDSLTPFNANLDNVEDTSKSVQKQYNLETGQIEDSIEKKTKKQIKQELLKKTGIMNVSLDEANKLPKILMENTDPIRLQEMIFGRGLGTDINNMFFQKVKDNTSEKIRFQNKERAEIKDLGIKARSKESAAVQKYGEKQWVNETTGEVMPYGDRELASEFPNLETQQKIKNASRVIRQKYDSYLDKTNKVLTKLGYDPIPKRKDYMRHFQELNDIFSRVGIPYNYNEMTANDLPTDINGLTADFSPSKNFFASALQRKGVKTTYDAITGIDGYLEGIGNLIYHTEDIQRLRAYEEYIRDTYGENHGFDNLEKLTDEEKAERIEKIQDNHLSNYASWLHEYTNTLAGKKALIDRSIEGLTGRKIYSFLNTTKTQVGRNMIGFNLSSAMTNVVAEVQALAKTNKLATIKGLADTVKNIFVKDGFVEKSNFLTSRFGSDMLSKNLWQKAGDAGFIFMQGTDNFISQLVVRSKYNEFKSKGLTDEQAHIEAGKFASRIMGDRSQGATANIYNSQMLGLVTQFQLEVNNQLYSMFYDTYHESKEVAKGNAAKTAVGMTYTLGQLAVLTHLFGAGFEAMAGYNPTFDILGMLMKAFGLDDEDEEETTGENLSQAFKQLVDALPYVNILTGGGRIPVSEAFTGVTDTFKALTGGKDEYGQDVEWADAWKSIKESAPYFLLPSGYSQIKKTSKGLGMYDEDLPIAGSYTDSGNLRFMADDSNWGKIQAGLFGQWATDEAQEYIDSDFKSIRSTDIDEMLELGMISSEYRDYKTGLSKNKKNEDKLDYISDLDVTDEQKTIMANNVLDRDYDVDMSIYDDFGSYEEFDYYYKYPEKYALGSAITDFKDYLDIEDHIWDLKADKDEEGKSITGTRKAKVIEYVNSLDLDIPQKAMLIREEYSSFNDYNYEIVEYVDGLDKDYEEKMKILEALNMKVEEDGTVSWE